uniref:Small ribosomal subunit protein uS17c n=1 Tax=Chlamydomonas leiostraca TaxID=1034604 RepID=A0A7S0S272_9CHLO|mmetsp:Transcript_4352/g.10815  ORF Transcript_4352/g.10815 Transcript_4352/m.10815 type:complete len:116 (+) Transcript_4352:27-374(+)|eukprot:CAMPEP_0202865336 /NCGR_PEP_ID=MMETSP1391-20130828/5723_1 /ASSEMBLY_ACC=CAM_ASM_000867 /TAXON_ID=1034604 /ORGANISM="Chlamydomonas leiostraca, Strain SAG 11-49" /LENGTH=115 /DNA_ID=CAMNT_0049545167 /DNA_START=27 /DNA_END=374 /DNA_ORIENTATION=-
MQSTILRGSAFQGAVRPATRPAAVSRRGAVVVQAVQDVKGTVVSTSMQNTIVVNVERLAPHPKYFKRVRTSKRYFAHVTEEQKFNIGDYVRLEGCRPLSKNKQFTVAEVIRKANE